MKTRFFTLLLLPFGCCPIFTSLHAQLEHTWTIAQGGPDSDLTGSCSIDHLGGIYTTVVLRDTTDLDPGPNQDIVNVGEDEVFVLSKFNTEGEYKWGGKFKTSGHAYGTIGEVKNNQILLLVYFKDTLWYDHAEPWTITNAGPTIAVLRLSLDGQVLSHTLLANSHDMYFSNFETQENGTILAGGGFEGSVTFFSADSTKTLHSSGKSDAFVSRFTGSGLIEWITVFGSTGYDFTEDIKVDENGSIYYAIIHDSILIMQTLQGTVISMANGEDNGIYGRMTEEGTIETAFLFGGSGGDQLRNIEADQEGHIYINGYFEGEVNFQHPSEEPVLYTSLNESDGFVAKYSPSGHLIWVRIFRSGEYGGVYTMHLHRNTHLYISGGYTDLSDLDPGPDTLWIDGGPQGDLFAAKFNTDGEMDWLYTFSGIGFEGIRNLIPSTDGRVYIHGYFFNTLQYDPASPDAELLSMGGSDLYLSSFVEQDVITSTPILPGHQTLVYPNPASNHFFIRSESPIQSVQLMSLDGMTISVNMDITDHIARIDVVALPAGLYLARTRTTAGENTAPVMVVR